MSEANEIVEGKLYDWSGAKERHKQKTLITIVHMLPWLITIPSVLKVLTGVGRTGTIRFVKLLEKKKLVHKMRFAGMPGPVLMLTSQGANWARNVVTDDRLKHVRYPSGPSGVNGQNVVHDLLVQLATLLLFGVGKEAICWPARTLDTYGWPIGFGEVFMDCLVEPKGTQTAKKERVALEVQESYEPAETMKRRLSRYAERISAGELQKVIYASTNPALLSRYKGVWDARPEPYWWYAKDKEWVRSDGAQSPVTDAIVDRFETFDLSQVARLVYSFDVSRRKSE
jgi:hypothetical protein